MLCKTPQFVHGVPFQCRKCMPCRINRRRLWTFRIMLESMCHPVSSFLTLTYDEDHVPHDHSLNYVDYQLFMKRLRKRFGKARFYMCGEYGENTSRPHFHACLFGIFFPDRELFRRLESGSNLYTSKVLNELWPYGFSSVGDVTFESAAYVARYVLKKMFDDKDRLKDMVVMLRHGCSYDELEEFEKRIGKEVFSTMSRRPGIGRDWFEKWRGDVFPSDFVVVRGMKMKPPRYYTDLFAVEAPEEAELLKQLKVSCAKTQMVLTLLMKVILII